MNIRRAWPVTSALLSAVSLAIVATASAADHPLTKASISIKRTAAGDEKIVIRASDAAFLFPAIDSTDDPAAVTGSGLVIQLFAASQPEAGLLTVPPGLGQPGWSVTAGPVEAYRFRNGTAPEGLSAVQSIVMQRGKGFKIVARRSGLAAGPLESLGLRIVSGSQRNCALFAGEAIRSDNSAFRATLRDGTTLTDCSAGVLGGSTCGNGIVENHEACDGAEDGRCPGACQSDCTCVSSSCGDNVMNSASEECDGTSIPPDLPSYYFLCSPSCTICSWDCKVGPCCEPGSTCLLSPGSGSCVSHSCIPPYECTAGRECTAEQTCCVGNNDTTPCSIAGQAVEACCGEAVCQRLMTHPLYRGCCNPEGIACSAPEECCSGVCTDGVCAASGG